MGMKQISIDYQISDLIEWINEDKSHVDLIYMQGVKYVTLQNFRQGKGVTVDTFRRIQRAKINEERRNEGN